MSLWRYKSEKKANDESDTESIISVSNRRACLIEKRLRDLSPVGVQASARASQESAGHIGPLAIPRMHGEEFDVNVQVKYIDAWLK